MVRGSDGAVTQMVPNSDVAWHAGNWYMNMHSIGIEQEGYAIQGATWYTERLYQSTARLVRSLAHRYHIPLDRQHIIGHDNTPSPTTARIPAMHWDPGPFWNWNHFMNLLGRHTTPTGTRDSTVVTINPVFAHNIQTVTDCETNTTVPPQPANFVYLRIAPDPSAPLFNDPGLHPRSPPGTPGSTCAADWGDKAGAGQQFAVADRHDDWVAIWWDGAKVWFDNPTTCPTATPTSARRGPAEDRHHTGGDLRGGLPQPIGIPARHPRPRDDTPALHHPTRTVLRVRRNHPHRLLQRHQHRQQRTTRPHRHPRRNEIPRNPTRPPHRLRQRSRRQRRTRHRLSGSLR